MPLTILRPRLDVPLEDHGAAIFQPTHLRWHRFNGFYSIFLIRSIYKKLSYSVVVCSFSGAWLQLYNMAQINVKQMFAFFKKKFERFLSYAQLVVVVYYLYSYVHGILLFNAQFPVSYSVYGNAKLGGNFGAFHFVHTAV